MAASPKARGTPAVGRIPALPEWLRIAALDGYVMLLLYLTGIPRLRLPERLSGRDLQLHFLAYMTLAGLTLWVMSGWELSFPGTWRLFRFAVVAWAFCLGFGAFDEWRQGFIPGRFTSLADWKADATGALAGVAFMALLLRWTFHKGAINSGNLPPKTGEKVTSKT
ncbi:MAG TPA: VanZ family protein [Candidatus Brocadiia bacterium]|nr:VanZ family protein [Candidatus Brocadiia bacterium]